MLKTRVITALVLVAVFAAAWFFSPAVFKALIAAAFMIAMGEWLLMLKVTPGALPSSVPWCLQPAPFTIFG